MSIGTVRRYDKKLYLTKRGDIYSIQGTHDGKRIRISTGTDNERRAIEMRDALQLSLDHGVNKDRDDLTLSWQKIAHAVRQRHQFHARARKMTFRLTSRDVFDLMQAADFRCTLSGVPFTRRERGTGAPPDPWSASLDRIENAHGYVPGNVRVVCLVANIAMNRWGLDTLIRLASGVTRNQTRAAIIEPEKLTNPDTIEIKNFPKLLIDNDN